MATRWYSSDAPTNETLTHHQMLASLIAEARRRHVFRATGLYAAAAFVLLQLADILMPAFGLSDGDISYLLLAIALGFPIVLGLTWLVDITPEGIKVTPMLSRGESAELAPGRLVDFAIIFVAIGVGFLYLERFLPDNVEETPAAVADATMPVPAPEVQLLDPSVAVLPFDNLSTSDENAIFAAGIHEDILNHLSRNAELMVTSRKSTLAYADKDVPMVQIASELGVNYIMEGSVRRAGDRAKITVQLIEAAGDKHLWSETYDRELNDIFAVQDEVAARVAEKLKVQFELLQEDRPTENLQAYELFLEARELYGNVDTEDTLLAIVRYREALQIDADFADAWSGLALAVSSPESDEDLEEAGNAAARALALRPESWMANWAMGSYLGNWRVERFRDSEPYYLKAIEQNPNNARLRGNYGFTLWLQGRSAEAATQFIESYRRNPLSAEANLARAMAAVFNNKHDVAVRHIERALSLDDDRAFLRWWAGNAYGLMQEKVTAVEQYEHALTLNPDHLPSLQFLSTLFKELGDLATASYWLDKAEAIDPYNTNTLWRRQLLLLDQERVDDAITLAEEWIKREPGNAQAQRVAAFLPSHRGEVAFRNENTAAFYKHRKEGLDIQLRYLESTRQDGELTVQMWNSWTFLSSAMSAKILGDDEMAREFNTKVIEFHRNQPAGALSFKHLQLAIAHAALGDNIEAVKHLELYRDLGDRDMSLINNYRLVDDQYGIYNGINKDVGFIGVMRDMENADKLVLSEIRQQFPGLSPPNTTTD
jgi:adenylate cyclase